jgi:N utilization substance protein B
MEDIPDSVSANEAVELAKTYGEDESSRFVNGILGRLIRGKEKERSLL